MHTTTIVSHTCVVCSALHTPRAALHTFGPCTGEDVPGLRLSGLTQSQQSQFLSGRLDMGRTSVMGHSYGGATAAMAASEHPELRAAVALDPWW